MKHSLFSTLNVDPRVRCWLPLPLIEYFATNRVVLGASLLQDSLLMLLVNFILLRLHLLESNTLAPRIDILLLLTSLPTRLKPHLMVRVTCLLCEARKQKSEWKYIVKVCKFVSCLLLLYHYSPWAQMLWLAQAQKLKNNLPKSFQG